MNDDLTHKHSVPSDRMAMASKVGPKAALLDIRLVKLKADASNITEKDPELARTSLGYAFRRDNGLGQLTVMSKFVYDLAESEESTSKPAVTIEAEYGLTYQVDDIEQFDDEHLRAFAEVNGFFNAWPFWRELAYSVIGRLGFSPTTMPSFRISSPAPVATED